MRPEQKVRYLKDIHDWASSEAYMVETEEIIRRYYQELALKPLDDITACGYRLALMIEKDRQKRYMEKKRQYEEIAVID